jgi:CO/xanthine dehydrogenase FAD-binding subunit
VTCGATVSLFSSSGIREVEADAFILGELETDLRSDEIIIDVHFPKWPRTRRWAFQEFAKRRGDFALGGVALYLDLDNAGVVTDCAVRSRPSSGAPPSSRRSSNAQLRRRERRSTRLRTSTQEKPTAKR